MTVLGLPVVLANINRIAGQILDAEGDGLADAGERVRQAWVDNIESEGLVLTGHYRDSIRVEMDDGTAAVLTDVEYASAKQNVDVAAPTATIPFTHIVGFAYGGPRRLIGVRLARTF